MIIIDLNKLIEVTICFTWGLLTKYVMSMHVPGIHGAQKRFPANQIATPCHSLSRHCRHHDMMHYDTQLSDILHNDTQHKDYFQYKDSYIMIASL